MLFSAMDNLSDTLFEGCLTGSFSDRSVKLPFSSENFVVALDLCSPT